jgi:hypothetical protein
MKDGNVIEQKLNIISALECQTECQKDPFCKLFNWNQNSLNCFLRTDLPDGANSFSKTPAAIVGARDCSDVSIIWPEIYPQSTSTSACPISSTTSLISIGSTTSTTSTSTSITSTTTLTTSTTTSSMSISTASSEENLLK